LGVAQIPLMNAEQLRQWVEGGQEVVAHTRHHTRLLESDDETSRQEIVTAKVELEGAVGVPVTQFCYPYGQYLDKHCAIVANAGFLTATTTQRSRCQLGEDTMQIPRIPVLRTTTLAAFWLKVTSGYEDKRRE
jgi:peptidoglycan/xylan/chitin deacetylase (PgdA/CDA1 family)